MVGFLPAGVEQLANVFQSRPDKPHRSRQRYGHPGRACKLSHVREGKGEESLDNTPAAVGALLPEIIQGARLCRQQVQPSLRKVNEIRCAIANCGARPSLDRATPGSDLPDFLIRPGKFLLDGFLIRPVPDGLADFLNSVGLLVHDDFEHRPRGLSRSSQQCHTSVVGT